MNVGDEAAVLHRWRGMCFRPALKEGSDFRNERDVVPAGIRAGPNPQNFFFVFLDNVVPCNAHRRATRLVREGPP